MPNPAKEMIGLKFGRLLVLERDGTQGGKATWKCLCDCGSTTTVVGARMRNGSTRSCGCMGPPNKLPEGEAAFNSLILKYKFGADQRNLDYELDRETFKALVDGNCHYCGAAPANVLDRKHWNGSYTYNGIDRKFNAVGYTKENCVSCCTTCNFLKREMDYDEFIALIKKIAENT